MNLFPKWKSNDSSNFTVQMRDITSIHSGLRLHYTHNQDQVPAAGTQGDEE